MSLITLDIEIFQLIKDNIGYYFYLDERIMDFICRKTSGDMVGYSHSDVDISSRLSIFCIIIRLVTYWIWLQFIINTIKSLVELISIIN